MRRWIPELVALPILPLLIAQGRRIRRITPRLPEAAGPPGGTAATSAQPAGTVLTLLAIGESPVAGVGVTTHEEAITGALARALAQRTNRPVQWQAQGKNGITVGQALQELMPAIPAAPVDIVLVAFGVNDSTAFRPLARWCRDIIDLLDALEARCAPRLIVLSGVPPLARFPALPQPLRAVMGTKARSLDGALQRIARMRRHTIHVPVALNPSEGAFMASDGYHPSAAGCTAWAGVLADAAHAVLERMSD